MVLQPSQDYWEAVDKVDRNAGELIRRAKDEGRDGIVSPSPSGTLFVAFSPDQFAPAATRSLGAEAERGSAPGPGGLPPVERGSMTPGAELEDFRARLGRGPGAVSAGADRLTQSDLAAVRSQLHPGGLEQGADERSGRASQERDLSPAGPQGPNGPEFDPGR